ncbi:hypothetical protein LDBUL1519_00832 [Lactobacillus delbrueckii subsp. bulgaricus CNCM I-1519]|nr:hypothetical protein LDBUL1519_00832 [Lactobacillus delbrueckii subsp. bulgaricus CNCM I-1519]
MLCSIRCICNCRFYLEEMFALLIATVLLIGIYAVAKELVKDWLKDNHRFGV